MESRPWLWGAAIGLAGALVAAGVVWISSRRPKAMGAGSRFEFWSLGLFSIAFLIGAGIWFLNGGSPKEPVEIQLVGVSEVANGLLLVALYCGLLATATVEFAKRMLLLRGRYFAHRLIRLVGPPAIISLIDRPGRMARAAVFGRLDLPAGALVAQLSAAVDGALVSGMTHSSVVQPAESRSIPFDFVLAATGREVAATDEMRFLFCWSAAWADHLRSEVRAEFVGDNQRIAPNEWISMPRAGFGLVRNLIWGPLDWPGDWPSQVGDVEAVRVAVEGRLDDIQVRLAVGWAQYIRLLACLVSGLYGLLAMILVSVTPGAKVIGLSTAFVVGGFVSWLVYDLTALARRPRRR